MRTFVTIAAISIFFNTNIASASDETADKAAGNAAGQAADKAADIAVCTRVVFGSLADPEDESPAAAVPADAPQPAAAPATSSKPNTLPPRAYLRRLIDHYVQHEPGFVAVAPGGDRACDETITVELFPTSLAGWTVFGRYTGFESEERVDRVEQEEFPRLARRLVKALLFDKRLEETITRTSVLSSDSAGEQKTVSGTHLFQLSVGSTFRFPVGGVPTRVDGDPNAPVTDRFRLLNNVDLQVGYRGDFSRWAIDAYARIGIGVSATDSRSNTLGGHVDHIADLVLGLNFLWHLAADDVWSFYLGPGARFELIAFDLVEPTGRSDGDDLVGAGLGAVAVFGFEFLRTASVRPFAQLEITLPAYVVRTEARDGGIDAWLPGATINVGALF